MTIKELRNITGLSQHKFAKKYHFNVQTVQGWEQGRRETPAYVLHLLERIITEVDYIDNE